MNSGDDSDDEPMSTEMLGEICNGSQYHPDIKKREARYKIRDRIRQRKLEWKVALLSMQKISKDVKKAFKTVVNVIS